MQYTTAISPHAQAAAGMEDQMSFEDVTIIPTPEENAAWDAEKRRALHDLATGQSGDWVVASCSIAGLLERVKFLLGERIEEMDPQSHSDAKALLRMAMDDFSAYENDREE